MPTRTHEASVELPCHDCGYDLRAHPADGKCPECGASIAESHRVAAIPRRPAWRDSDPRWRRRMLAGAWVLVLLPLMVLARRQGWLSDIPAPQVFDFRHTVRTLDETLLSYTNVYEPLVFSTGAVLLFSKERGRRRNRLDWTRRWGVLCTYVSFLLNLAGFLFIGSLVLAGIASVFQGMPLRYQPAVTPLLARLGAFLLAYGPQPMEWAAVVLAACSSIVILLACTPLFDALRSSGPKRLALLVLAPLALFALMHLAQAGRSVISSSRAALNDVSFLGLYFRPQRLLNAMPDLAAWGLAGSEPELFTFVVEVVKWTCVLAIAIWLTIAQLTARLRAKRVHG